MHDDRGFDGGARGFSQGPYRPSAPHSQPPPQAQPKPQHPQQAPEEFKRWEYEDPDGNIQGPFYASQILTWFRYAWRVARLCVQQAVIASTATPTPYLLVSQRTFHIFCY
jgi:hypothetical protein